MTTTKPRTRRTPTSTDPGDLAALVSAGTVTIEAIDVATAQLDPNVRTDTTYTTEFADSIKTDGVREPVYARRATDGTVYIWDGQRRTLAAQEAGITTMLGVFGLTPATAKDSQRILDQLRTFNRADLTLADRIAAYEQLALDGISETAIVRAAGESRDLVKKSLTVARSDCAKQAAQDRGQLSLDKLILIAEFDGDQDAIDQITLIEDDDDLPYAAQEIRDDHAIRETTAKLVGQYAADGVQVFTEWSGLRSLDRLTDALDDAADRPAVTTETHSACEGRAVYLTVWGSGEDDHRTEEVCTRPELHHERFGSFGNTASAAIPADETDEQRQEREEAEAVTRKAERARVLANNKAWRTATTVRCDWVTRLLTRKSLPKDAIVFFALTLTEHAHTITDYKGGDLIGTFLNQPDNYYPRSAAATLVESTPTKAGHVALAVALSAREARAEDVEGWRHPSAVIGSYLLQLEAWGHKLAPVERIAAGYPEAAEEALTAAEPEPTEGQGDRPDAH
ncbi:ParB/RepB/Spo0J family partition protein [Leifsonia aquatica]|uniref:ParB/RepB/Spo0J family partition protein n=1 Tax=Leifsonia aquatica TaxID=144185 RepID=UPI0028B16E43|nr:ParB N-terminal domain-containing protein [Leifsonia aquatica]